MLKPIPYSGLFRSPDGRSRPSVADRVVQRVRRGNKEDAQRLINRLLACAMDMFSEGGVRCITMRSLASRAGVSAMTPYRYFINKAALLDALFDSVATDLSKHQRQAVEKAQGAEARLRAGVVAYLDYWEAHPISYGLIHLQSLTVCGSQTGFSNDLLLSKIHGFSHELTLELAQSLGVDPALSEPAMRIRDFILSGYLHSNWVNCQTSEQIKNLRPMVIEQAIESSKRILMGVAP